jgi:hypothetical protein
VLFIGNSYTSVNNLPQMTSQVANGMGDTLDFEMSAPGGYTLQNHCQNANTLALIAQGGWDDVVLQEQSQYPSFPLEQVEAEVFPYARTLDSLIHIASPCAHTIFYMTWGRKNGDPDNCPVWPPVCTYEGMDSLLQLRYTMMAADNHAWISPVAKVRRYLINNDPEIELYQADESHPSLAGTYAAALCFYNIIFGNDASATNYTAGLNEADVLAIKNAAQIVAFDSLATWRQYAPALESGFSYTNDGAAFTFVSTAIGTDIQHTIWNFGDGSPAMDATTAVHTFSNAGTYTVCLEVANACDSAISCQDITVNTVGVHEIAGDEAPVVVPNPVTDFLSVQHALIPSGYRILDINGREIQAGKLSKHMQTLDMCSFPNGIYYLELIHNNNKARILKIVKQ